MFQVMYRTKEIKWRVSGSFTEKCDAIEAAKELFRDFLNASTRVEVRIEKA